MQKEARSVRAPAAPAAPADPPSPRSATPGPTAPAAPAAIPGPAALLFEKARLDLWAAWREANETTNHPGIKGDIREDACRKFLSKHLPARLRVATGEAVDSKNRQSRQLDIMVWDSGRGATLREGSDIRLPAEALLSVVEVKSTLTREKLEEATANARSVRSLRPYGEKFGDCRPGGQASRSKSPRCFFTLFAFKSDLSPNDWLRSEWKRTSEVLGSDLGLIDRIVVLEHGLLNPFSRRGMTGSPEATLWNWFVELSNFLENENARRGPIGWASYGHFGETWEQLEARPEPPQPKSNSQVPRGPRRRTRPGRLRKRPTL